MKQLEITPSAISVSVSYLQASGTVIGWIKKINLLKSTCVHNILEEWVA